MCIQRVRGNCHQFVVFFSFTFHFLPSHFGLFFVLFLPFAKLRSIRSERTRRQTDLFCLILYYRVLFHLFHLLLFDSAVLFTIFQAHTPPGFCFWRSSSSNCPTAASTSRYKHRNLSRSFSGGEGGGVSDEDPMVPVDVMVTPYTGLVLDMSRGPSKESWDLRGLRSGVLGRVTW